MSGGTGGFQRLVRLVARLFYAEEVPPPEVPLDDVPAPRRSKTPQGPQSGLGVIVLDALTRREWVQEDYVPRPREEGEAPDPKPPGLAQQLRIHPKLLRRVLRHFEQEQIVAREHRRETTKRRRRAGDPAPNAAAASMLAGQVAVTEEDGEATQRQLTHSYCCVDYPRFIDMLQLRLHLMRKQLKEAEADSKPLQGYSCPGCGASYSSMDAPRLLDFATGEFHCEDCNTGLVQLFAGGQTGDDAERRRRREASRALLAHFERTVKPVRDLLAALRDKQPPDYGPLQDWAIEKQRQAELARRRAARGGRGGGGGGGGEDYLYPTVTNVELDTGESGDGAAEEAAEAAKVLPPWMLRDGIERTDASAAGAEGPSVDEAARAAAEREAVERAYVQAWLARAGALGGAPVGVGDEKKAAASEGKPEAQEAKRVKTEGGWAAVSDGAGVPGVKPEPESVAAGAEAKLEWDDVTPPQAVLKAEPAAAGNSMPDPSAAPGDEAAADDEFAWEDV